MVNNKSFAIISCLMALIIAMVCCFAFLMPKGNNNSASADTYDEYFTGSSIVIPQTDNWVKNSDATSTYNFIRSLMIGFNFNYYNNSTLLYINTLSLPRINSSNYLVWLNTRTATSGTPLTRVAGFSTGIGAYPSSLNYSSINLTSHTLISEGAYTYNISNGEFFYLRSYLSNSYSDFYYLPNMGFNFSGAFLGLPVSVMLGSRTVAGQSYFHNFIRYYDSSDNYFEFFFVYWADSMNNYPTRTYYFGNSPDYNAGFTAGKETGYNEGLAVGGASGYNDGYSVGYSAGDGAGYIRGVAEANNYSFIGLIGALIDAPIQAFTGLFNFEVFGVNMRSFFLSMMTLCIVLVVIRLILARKE